MPTKKEPKEVAEIAEDESEALEEVANKVEDAAREQEDQPLADKAANVAAKAGEIERRAQVAQIKGLSESTAQAMLEEVRALRKELAAGVKKSTLSDLFNIFDI